MLSGEGETILTDDERHAELIRLKWEAGHIAGAGDFQQAALAVGLSERHHAEGDIASEMLVTPQNLHPALWKFDVFHYIIMCL